jgi:hypothetical protein
MGCAASFPADDEKYLNKNKQGDILRQTLAPDLVSPAITTLHLKKNWKDFIESTGDYTVQTADGKDYLTIKADAEGNYVISNPKGDLICVLQTELQNEMIIGCECVQQVKFLYVCAPKPYNPNLKRLSDVKSDGQPLCHWARVHGDPVIVGQPSKFCITMAQNTPSDDSKPTMDIYSAETYTAKWRKDCRISAKDFRSRGSCVVDFNEDDAEMWKVSIAPKADPVLFLASVLQIHQYVSKTTGKEVYWTSTRSNTSTISTISGLDA